MISDNLKELIMNRVEHCELQLTEDTLLSNLGFNSYEIVELACEIEEKFDIEIPDRIISRWKTVKNIQESCIPKEEGM